MPIGRSGRDLAGRPRRAVLAYEFGAGRTHVSHILGVVERLREAGVECLASLYDLRAAAEFAALGTPVVQSYLWPGRRRFAPHGGERPDHGLVDLLANLGLADGDAVAAALAHYDGLFALFQPDIVLAENGFGALLAARGRMPAIAFGFNQLLPPPVDGTFPTFEGRTSSWSDAELLSGLNEGLRRGGRPPLAGAADLLAVDAVLPFGPDAFDLYRKLRPSPVLPVHVRGYRPGMRGGSGDEVFVYLQRDGTGLQAILAALLGLRRPTRAFLPDADAETRELLTRAGIAIEPEPVPIGMILERSRCVLHHGGVELSCTLLAAGLPQVILAKELDNQAQGRLVAADGLGDHCWLWDATTPWIVEATRRAYDDDAITARCRARAGGFDGWFGSDPCHRVAEEALRLLAT